MPHVDDYSEWHTVVVSVDPDAAVDEPRMAYALTHPHSCPPHDLADCWVARDLAEFASTPELVGLPVTAGVYPIRAWASSGKHELVYTEPDGGFEVGDELDADR